MMFEAQAKMSPPPSPWEKFVRWTRVRDLRWWMVPGLGLIYRAVVIFGHRFGWHHMRERPLLPGQKRPRLHCDWCGADCEKPLTRAELGAIGSCMTQSKELA